MFTPKIKSVNGPEVCLGRGQVGMRTTFKCLRMQNSQRTWLVGRKESSLVYSGHNDQKVSWTRDLFRKDFESKRMKFDVERKLLIDF